MASLRAFLSKLISHTSGNTALILAFSLPAIIGTSGLAVDTAQWFMWKREMQFAVDQAALAGAWARTDDTTSANYAARALQEYQANVQTVKDFDSTPEVTLVSLSGSSSGVQVVATATKSLPFSSFLTKTAATIRVSARASFSAGSNYTGCIVALHPTMQGAFTLGGDASGSATCGVVALSNHPTAAMVKNGNSTAQLGMLVAAGGIDSAFSSNGTMHPNISGLSDPFGDVSTPNPSPSPARTFTCPAATAAMTTTTATKQVNTVTTYVYVTGNNSNQALTSAQNGTNTTTYSPATAGSTNTGTAVANVTVPNGTLAGSFPLTSYTYVRQVQNSPKKHEIKKVVTTTIYSNIAITTVAASDGIARPSPGTYGDINITCQTEFSPGIYVVDTIDFGQNMVVTGSDVLFIIKTSNGMHINSNSNINLSGITEDTLTGTYGFSNSLAERMASMVIFDKLSTDQIKINGTSDVVLNGIVYTPARELWFNGTSAVSGKCMMVVAGIITYTGTTDMNSFCIPSGATNMNTGGSQPEVKLVS